METGRDFVVSPGRVSLCKVQTLSELPIYTGLCDSKLVEVRLLVYLWHNRNSQNTESRPAK